MCFQAIAELMGSMVGIFIIAVIAVFVLILLGGLVYVLGMFLLGIFINILLILTSPWTWIILIILIVAGYFLLKS